MTPTEILIAAAAIIAGALTLGWAILKFRRIMGWDTNENNSKHHI